MVIFNVLCAKNRQIAEAFGILERGKDVYKLEDYSISKISLEQVSFSGLSCLWLGEYIHAVVFYFVTRILQTINKRFSVVSRGKITEIAQSFHHAVKISEIRLSFCNAGLYNFRCFYRFPLFGGYYSLLVEN